MIDVPVTDSVGNVLLLSTEMHSDSFNAVTCSPRTYGGLGLGVLFRYINWLHAHEHNQLEDACQESISRNELCILPKDISSKHRVVQMDLVLFVTMPSA